MPLQTVWAWTMVISGNSHSSGPVSGSMDVHIPSQQFAYISTALQNFRVFQPPISPESFAAVLVDANPAIASVNGIAQPAGSTVVFGNNVISVVFNWTLSLGPTSFGVAPYEANAQFLFQILGSG
jgi:hypothetical protein